MINGGAINSFALNGTTAAATASESITEDVSLQDVLTDIQTVFGANLLNSMTMQDVPTDSQTEFGGNLVEDISAQEILIAIRLISFFETINLSSGIIEDVVFGLGDSLSVQHLSIDFATTTVILSSDISLDDVLRVILSGNILEDLTVNHTQAVFTLFLDSLSDIFSSSDSVAESIIALNQLALSITVADSLLDAFLGDITENITVSQSSIDLLALLSQIIDAITVNLSSGDFLLLLSSVIDGFSVDDSQSTFANVNESILDNMDMVVLGEGGDVYSGWILSPETFAVWNYDNYNFNSLATLSGKTFLANSSGLFTMEGNLDDTSFIKSKLKTAAFSFGTTNLKQVPDMYIHMSLTGEMVIGVTTDERVNVKYKLKAPTTVSELQTIKLGKGIRGSLWQFELIDDKATELEITGMEWIPVVFGRKRR